MTKLFCQLDFPKLGVCDEVLNTTFIFEENRGWICKTNKTASKAYKSLLFRKKQLDIGSFFLTGTTLHLELKQFDLMACSPLAGGTVEPSMIHRIQEMGILPKDSRKGSHVSIISQEEREHRH
jgi:hypothetical protein